MKKKLLLLAGLATAFHATSQAQTFANAGFETWHDYNVSTSIFPPASISLSAPDSWCGVDSLIAGVTPIAGIAGIALSPSQQLFKSTVAHSGSFAAEIKSVFLGDSVGDIPGVFVNAKINIDMAAAVAAFSGTGNVDLLSLVNYSGGTAITAQVDTVKAWVQLDSASNLDEGTITVTAIKTVAGSSGDSTVFVGVGSAIVARGTAAFRQIAVPVIYTDNTVPLKLIVAFMSSNYAADTIHAGNDMKVDDVTYSYKTNSGTAIVQPLMSENNLLVYPNPTKNQIYFNLNAAVKPTDFNLSVYDISGRLISKEALKQAINSKNVAGWAKGTYYYQLNNNKNNQSEKGQFIVE